MPTPTRPSFQGFQRYVEKIELRVRALERGARTAGGFTVAWGDVTGKPSDFPTNWGLVSGKPSNFPNDTKVDKAGPDGASRYTRGPDPETYANTVSGGGFFAVWMDNGQRFGRNTSSLRYKKNVRPHAIEPAKVLSLQPVLYDRRDEEGPTEYGLVAEEVAEAVPELAVYFDGKIDGVRYDLLAVALLDTVRDLSDRLAALEAR